MLTLTAVWRTADMGVSARALSSDTIADGKLLARLRRGHTSHRLGFRKEVFKSWEVGVPITIVTVIAGRGISDYVDSALTRIMVYKGGFSYTPVRMLQNKAVTLCVPSPSESGQTSSAGWRAGMNAGRGW